MPEGGTIHISTKNVVLDTIYCGIYEIPPGRYVQIFITDSGHGMDKQTQARIFDPFFTTKEIGRGTGLGLASVYGIIKNHNGFIDVYSEPDQGTTFTIYLPASDKAAQLEPARPEPAELKPGQGTILLVDDEAMILEVGREMLKIIGYTVATAGSGKEACEMYQREPGLYSAVILDMIMPDMDGGAVFERLKEIDPEVKVLLSSGYSLNDKASGIMARGCAGFLQKPFDLNKLSAKLQEIL
jgi:CheY-like chemotaxis protein